MLAFNGRVGSLLVIIGISAALLAPFANADDTTAPAPREETPTAGSPLGPLPPPVAQAPEGAVIRNIAGGSASATTTNSLSPDFLEAPLTFNGGYVQHTPHVYVIFWGNEWTKSENATTKNLLREWYKSVGGTSYSGILTQYFDAGGQITGQSYLAASYVDTRQEHPVEASVGKMLAEVHESIISQGWGPPNVENQYVVIAPPRTTLSKEEVREEEETGGQICGYHTWQDPEHGGPIVATLVYARNTNGNCDPRILPIWQSLQGTLSHEWAEAATDPIVTDQKTGLHYLGWTNGIILRETATEREWEAEEIADHCEAYNAVQAGPSFWVDLLWDNYENARGTRTCTASDGSPESLFPGTSTGVPSSAFHHGQAFGALHPAGFIDKYHFTLSEPNHGEYQTEPIPEGETGEGEFGAVPVTASFSGLKGERAYHVQLAALNQAMVGEISEIATWQWGQEMVLNTPSLKPVVTVSEPKEEFGGHVLLQGSVNPQEEETQYWLEWGGTAGVYPATEAEQEAAALEHGWAGAGTQPVPILFEQTGLKGETTYHYRIKGRNGEGVTRAADYVFTTPDWRPAVALKPATDKPGTVTVHATINPMGFHTSYIVKWDTLKDGEHESVVEDAGEGTSPKTLSYTFAAVGETSYGYELVATNVEGNNHPPATGGITTPDWRPIVAVEEPAESVRASRATLSGSVNPNGFPTSYQFEYGPSTQYGSVIPLPGWEEKLAPDELPLPVATVASTLEPETTYHYRLSGTNREGTHVTDDHEFTTRGPTALCRALLEGGCTTADQYPVGTEVRERLMPGTSATFQTTGLSFECRESELVGRVSGEGGTPMNIEVTEARFGHCLSLGLPVYVTAESLPYLSGLLYEGGGSGSVGLSGRSAPIGITTDYTFYGQTCRYSIPSVTGGLKGGVPATIQVHGLMMKESGTTTYCGSETGSTFSGNYELAVPEPAFAVPAPKMALCHQAINPCPENAQYRGALQVEAKLSPGTKAIFKGEDGVAECASSEIYGEGTSLVGPVVSIEIRALTFTNCTGVSAASAAFLPYMAALERTEGSDGTVGITGNAGGRHPVIVFQGCGDLPCAIGALELIAAFKGGSPPTLVLESAPLPLGEVNEASGNSVELTASYSLTRPSPLFAGAGS